MKTNLEFLYEDNHVLVVNKKPGMLSQGDISFDLDVLELAKRIIKVRDNKPGNVFLGLVHRLDRPVGGAMVLSKTSKAAGRLSEQFRKRQTTKIYRAVVEGTPEPTENGLKHFLIKDRKTRVTHEAPREHGGREATLRYRVLERAKSCSLVEITLGTGLPHQIRVQLSLIGHPILGDRKYGATPSQATRVPRGTIALHSHSISFFHPISKESVRVAAPVPDTFPWSSLTTTTLI